MSSPVIKRTRKTRGPMDALELLKKDHDSVRTLFGRYDKALTGSPERETLIQNICHDLEMHAAIEEELFYPALQDPEFGSSEFGLSMGAGDIQSGDRHRLHDQEDETSGDEYVSSTNGAAGYDEEETVDLDEWDDEWNIIGKAYEDHGIVKALIEDLRHRSMNSQEKHDLLLILRDAVINHMKEEEDQLFPIARINLDLKQLGFDLRAKQNILRKTKAA